MRPARPINGHDLPAFSEPVRRAHLVDLLARKTVSKGTMAYVAAELVSNPSRLGDANDTLTGELTGHSPAKGDRSRRGAALAYLAATPENRMVLVALAQVAAAVEQSLDVYSWRNPSSRDAAYLTYLAGTGCTLSDVEQTIVRAEADRQKKGATTKREPTPGTPQSPRPDQCRRPPHRRHWRVQPQVRTQPGGMPLDTAGHALPHPPEGASPMDDRYHPFPVNPADPDHLPTVIHRQNRPRISLPAHLRPLPTQSDTRPTAISLPHD